MQFAYLFAVVVQVFQPTPAGEGGRCLGHPRFVHGLAVSTHARR